VMEEVAEEGPDQSFAEFAAHANFDRRAKHAATSYVEGFNAARAEVVGIQSLAQDAKAADAIEGDRSFNLPGGYDAVAYVLLPSSDGLHLNTIAERVHWKPGQVIVHVRSAVDGAPRMITARRLIVTVSLGVLQANAIQFEPEPVALAAARELAFGQVMRVTLRFERLPNFLRPGFLLSDEPVFPTWWTTLPMRAPVITGWSAGPKADTLLGQPTASVVAQALDSLRRIVGTELPPVAAAYLHDWHADPFFRGAYSYVPVGKSHAREKLAEPIADTLYFAGEAANISGHSATVHGAIESGVRAAQLSLVPTSPA
jgi:monoamine oxidase